MINYTEKIPNNVDLGRDRVLQRALEHWQPAFLGWWYDMGPTESRNYDVYLRTAISVEPDSCFAGTLLELALAADRIYMRDTQEGASTATMTLSEMNFGPLPMVNHVTRVAARFYQDANHMESLRRQIGKKLSAREALEAGLVTSAPDDLDWEDEIRQAMESRTAQSPDALTGLEANLRLGPEETPETRIFGRLSAWQNWIFIRPNAVGQSGALKVYGTGAPVKFDWEKV